MSSIGNLGAVVRRILVCGCLSVLPVVTAMAASDEENRDHLLYKEALYHIYNNDYFKALNLLESEHTGTNTVVNEYHNRNHLLAVKAGLHLGMFGYVRDVLEHLSFTSRGQAIQDLAQMYWGQLHYQQGQWDEAIVALKKVGNALPPDARDEAYYYLVMSYLKQGQPEVATPILAKMAQKSLWSAYGYYNLAMYYHTQDGNSSRALVALRVASTMSNGSEEGRAIRDRIYTTGGYLALQEQEYSKAISFLQKVGIKSESAPAAIYAHGVAYAGLGQFRDAVQMWHRARKYSLVLPGVADSFRAMAYGFEQENVRASAIDAYTEAVSAYERESVLLKELMRDVEQRGALKALLEDQPVEELEWFLLTDVVTNTPKVGFIGYLMSDEHFYQSAKTLLELRELQKTVQQGGQRLKVFEGMLKDQQKGFHDRVSKSASKTRVRTFNELVAQRNRLAQELQSAERERDYLQFLPLEQGDQYERIEILKREAGSRSTGGPDSGRTQDRLKRLEGILLWDGMVNFDRNRQSVRATMSTMDEQVSLYKDNLQRFQERASIGPDQYRESLERVQSLIRTNTRLSRELDGLVAEIDVALTAQAVELLDKHHNVMGRYKLEGQMALLNLFDQVSVANNTPAPVGSNARGAQ